MEQDQHKREKLLAKFQPFMERAGGIFGVKTRARLLGIEGLSGRNRTKDDFWHDQRESVKMALIDLDLFIEAADDNSVNQVITRETLEPIVNELLWGPVFIPPPPDRAKLYLERARIADLFIKWGFEYLSSMNSDMMSLSHKRTMEDAIDLSRLLLETFKTEWPYYPEVHGKHQDKTDSAEDKEK